MKKRLISLCLCLCLAASGLPGAWGEARQLTVMLYLCGTDLESQNGQASTDLQEIVASGAALNPLVEVIVCTGGAGVWKRYGISAQEVQYYRVVPGGLELLSGRGDVSMGGSDTLRDFIDYGCTNYPADRMALILWDHGAGPVGGLCCDENHGDDPLTMNELSDALKGGLHGRKLDILTYDACLMNCIEICALSAEYADYIVASQELVSGTGLDYDTWLRHAADNPYISARELAVLMASTYIDDNNRGFRRGSATMAVIDGSRVVSVSQAIDRFGLEMTGLLETNLPSVMRARSGLSSFGEFLGSDASDLVDTGTVCDAFTPLLPEACSELRRAVSEAVIYNGVCGDLIGRANGLSMLMPYATVRYDSYMIHRVYDAEEGGYAAFVTQMTDAVLRHGGDYVMDASSQSPDNFYTHTEDGGYTGSFVSIWNGYYGDTLPVDSTDDAAQGNIWAGLNAVFGGQGEAEDTPANDAALPDLWAGWGPADQPEVAAEPLSTGEPTPAATAFGIWAGHSTSAPEPTAAPAPSAAGSTGGNGALGGIWSGLIQTGDDYYQSGQANDNVQAGVSDSVTPEQVVSLASTYFSEDTALQSIYTLQLTRNDLDHLVSASGVLSVWTEHSEIRLGDIGETIIDWSTGMVYSMFDGTWPMLDGRLVRAERLYINADGSGRFVIPVKIDGQRMYLVASQSDKGDISILGATQGYDANGYAIRGYQALTPGMRVEPLLTEVMEDGTEIEYAQDAVIVPSEGLKLAWGELPPGNYAHCFALVDLSGGVQYTQSATIRP
ncbi:MAG: hypothetical protein IJJ23_11665 [Clostridia bacterium]|nr:hypothetical protein [Clostridia bacterium]